MRTLIWTHYNKRILLYDVIDTYGDVPNELIDGACNKELGAGSARQKQVGDAKCILPCGTECKSCDEDDDTAETSVRP